MIFLERSGNYLSHMMISTVDNIKFNPDWASPTRDTIKDILSERKISVEEFSKLLNLGLDITGELLNGNKFITLGLAKKLSEILGASVEFWMLRDYQYWSFKELLIDKSIIYEPYQPRMKI